MLSSSPSGRFIHRNPNTHQTSHLPHPHILQSSSSSNYPPAKSPFHCSVKSSSGSNFKLGFLHLLDGSK
ncbi:hypothetical protein Tco_1559606, partial [Tanacetum coccineum]